MPKKIKPVARWSRSGRSKGPISSTESRLNSYGNYLYIWTCLLRKEQVLLRGPGVSTHPGNGMIQPPHPGSLLIVDDREDIRRAMNRFFKLYFENVYVAATPKEAERILKENQPTFLLCDYWLGDDFPPSTELIPQWRKLATSLKCVALMTGTKVAAIAGTQCADVVFQKPLEPMTVVDFFIGAQDKNERT